MLKRPTAAVPDVDIYVCGFPCTPYSSLRGHATTLLKDPNAKPYFAMLRYLRAKLPALAILENVIGLNKVMNRVLRDFEQLGCYHIIRMPIDPMKLGEPVSRPRYYFVLLRHDACISTDTAAIADFCRRCLKATCRSPHEHIKSRMLPSSAPEVSRFLGLLAQRSSRPAREGTKWQAKHEDFSRRVLGFSRVPGSSANPALPPRQSEALDMLKQSAGTSDVIVDLSQSIERAHTRTNGVCPTITPRGMFFVGAVGRALVPSEKLLLHGFPLHRMQIPREVPDEALGKMGGNTMHLHAVGLALLMGIRLLRDPVPVVSPALFLGKTKPVLVSI